MSLIVNGVTLPSSAVITCNGVKLSSIVCNGVEVWKNGTLTLKEVVFNASGTFTMPSNVVNNQIIVGCTGGGGGGVDVTDVGSTGGAGCGRIVSTLTMTAGQTATVIVGAGGLGKVSFGGGDTGGAGGSSSFTGATSCPGANGGKYGWTVAGTNGGGNSMGGSSSIPAALTLLPGAVDGTTGLWTAKSYPGGAYGGGGGGCYGVGSGSNPAAANSGAGGYTGNGNGGSGKVVVWYYTYV